MSGPGVKADHFAIWPTALAFCFPLIWVALWSGPFDLAFAGEFILLVTWSCSALLALAFAIFSASSRLWWRAASISILPLVTLVIIANAGTAGTLAVETGERIHFHVMRRSYLADVSKLPSSGEPRFAMWIWGGFVIGHGVIYDESDEIMLPVKSPAWKKRVANTDVGECGAWGAPLGNHFYLVRIGC